MKRFHVAALAAAALLASSAAYAETYHSDVRQDMILSSVTPEGNGHVDVAQARPEGNGHVDIAGMPPEGYTAPEGTATA